MNQTIKTLAIAWLGIGLCANAVAGWLGDDMFDTEDGMFDVSDYLASARGFLPVPIIITEPAVGAGLGAAVAYFHAPVESDADKHPHRGPPSISVALGARTENGTYFYGGGHMGVWKDDHIRYTGAVVKSNINLAFYLDGRSDQFAQKKGIDFNIEGAFLLQKAQFRLKESNWWIGASYVYVSAENTFEFGSILPPEIPNPAFDFDLGGLGLYLQYDGRNTTFTPSDGLSAKLEYTNFDDNWGSDYAYNTYRGSLFHYTPFGSHSSLGLRLDAQGISGKAPFFSYPYISLRGIPAMRYQGETVLVAEAEYLWGVTPRWSVVFFGGAGKTDSIPAFGEKGQTEAAGGLGFRYRLARKLGLQAGVDIARGPEDTSIYLTVGSAWRF